MGKYTCLLIAVFCSQWLSGQSSRSFPYFVYNEKNGLTGNSVYGLIQANDEFIWAGTDYGVMRFDGSNFMSDILKGEEVPRIVDRLFKRNGSIAYLVESFPPAIYSVEKDVCVKLNPDIPIPSGRNFSQSKTDSSLTFWVENKIYLVEDQEVRMVYKFNLEQGEHIVYFYNFGRGSYFISTNLRGIQVWNGLEYVHTDLANTTSILETKSQVLVFAADAIYLLREKKAEKYLPLPDNTRIQYSLLDNDGNLWLAGVNQGLYLLQKGTITDVSDHFGIKTEQITYLFRDQKGNIWISTISTGLICILKSAFTNYTEVDGLTSGNIICLSLKGADLMVGTNTGLNYITENLIFDAKTVNRIMNVPKNQSDFSDGYINSILSYKDKWIVSSGNKIQSKERSSQSDLRFAKFSSAMNFGDTILYSAWGHLMSRCFDCQNPFYKKKKNETPFQKEYFIHPLANKGRILIGTSSGLFEMDKKFEQINKLTCPTGDETLFYSVAEDKDHNLWFGTSKGLLCQLGKDHWTSYTQSDGLSSNELKALCFDKKGRLWIGTDKGLNVMENAHFRLYSTGNGLISNIIHCLAFDSTNTMLWIGTNKGLAKLETNRMAPGRNISFPLYIKALEIVGDSMFQPKGWQELHWKNNYLRVHFASVNYNNPSEVVYQYRLLPTDTNWRPTDLTHAEFPALAPDEYIFEVQSKISGSEWGQTTSVQFAIVPPFWRTNLFYAGLVLLFLLLVLLLVRWRFQEITDRERKKNEMALRIAQLEQQALSLSMNPHFIFNSLNSIQHFYSHVENRKANDFIARFSKLIRINLDSAGLKTIRLSDEINRLHLYLSLEKERFEKSFEFKITIPELLSFENPEIPTMLIQPLVENAIWHGILPSTKPGRLDLYFRLDGDILTVEVVDNGIGPTAAEQNKKKGHISKGLLLTKERIAHLAKENSVAIEELFDASGAVSGTRVTLRLLLEE